MTDREVSVNTTNTNPTEDPSTNNMATPGSSDSPSTGDIALFQEYQEFKRWRDMMKMMEVREEQQRKTVLEQQQREALIRQRQAEYAESVRQQREEQEDGEGEEADDVTFNMNVGEISGINLSESSQAGQGRQGVTGGDSSAVREPTSTRKESSGAGQPNARRGSMMNLRGLGFTEPEVQPTAVVKTAQMKMPVPLSPAKTAPPSPVKPSTVSTSIVRSKNFLSVDAIQGERRQEQQRATARRSSDTAEELEPDKPTPGLLNIRTFATRNDGFLKADLSALKSVQIWKFTESEGENYWVWRQQVYNVLLTLYDVTPSWIGMYLQKCCGGTAEIYVRENYDRYMEMERCDEIFKDLDAQFGQKWTDYERLYHMCNKTTHQREGESVEAYELRLKKIRGNWELSVPVFETAFFMGLLPRYQKQSLMAHKSFVRVVQAVKAEETRLKQENEFLREREERLKKFDNQYRRSGPSTSTNNGNSVSSMGGGSSSSDSLQKSDGQIYCETCKKKGDHTERYCPKRRAENICGFCKKKGHYYSRCPERKEPEKVQQTAVQATMTGLEVAPLSFVELNTKAGGVVTLLDSGAQISLIRAEMFERLNLIDGGLVKKESTQLNAVFSGFNGSDCEVTDVVSLDTQELGLWRFWIVEGLAFDMVLGNDWIGRYNMMMRDQVKRTISYGQSPEAMEVTLKWVEPPVHQTVEREVVAGSTHGEEAQMEAPKEQVETESAAEATEKKTETDGLPVKTRAEIEAFTRVVAVRQTSTIKPGTIGFVTLKVYGRKSGLIEPLPGQTAFISKALVQPRQGKVTISLINPWKDKITLHAGQQIATFTRGVNIVEQVFDNQLIADEEKSENQVDNIVISSVEVKEKKEQDDQTEIGRLGAAGETGADGASTY